jgi:hypothetical protein
MKFIKLTLISIVLLFIVATGVSLFIPSTVRISKAINLAGPKDSIWHLIRDTQQWQRWNPAFMSRFPQEQQNNMQAILVRATGSETVFLLKQPNKQPVTSVWKIYDNEGSDSLTLQWYMDLTSSWYPWQKLGTLLYEPTFGAMMQQGLTNIKNIEQAR